MSSRTSGKSVNDLYAANTPDTFWKVLIEPAISQAEWMIAVQSAASVLPQNAGFKHAEDNIISAVLGEQIFGDGHWRLSLSKRIYYHLKPIIPRKLGLFLRKGYRQQQETSFALNWPVEDRYVRFQYAVLAHILQQRELSSLSYVNFWPQQQHAAFVLTHDVEEAPGHAFVEAVADLEERYGFRSSFNFVPERYPVDQGLLSSLRQRGFEIGVHGLKHDGKLFSSRRGFEQRAAKINQYLRAWEAVGFRTPYTHRHPQWMQQLNVEYDLSFFDTDPYEPMAGGTMSPWPFFLGTFVELPYTLVQDHTLMVVLGEQTPRLWLDKVDLITQWNGMILVNVHPDYLRKREHFAIYEEFLRALTERQQIWHALPREVARWWRARAQLQPCYQNNQWDLSALPEATSASFSLLQRQESGV